MAKEPLYIPTLIYIIKGKEFSFGLLEEPKTRITAYHIMDDILNPDIEKKLRVDFKEVK